MASATIEINITGLYVSCVGTLCITVSYPKSCPDVFEVIGVDNVGKWIVRQIT